MTVMAFALCCWSGRLVDVVLWMSVHARCRCPEHGLLNSTSPPHDKADICAVWDALCFGLPPPLALTSTGLSPVDQGKYLLAFLLGAFATCNCTHMVIPEGTACKA